MKTILIIGHGNIGRHLEAELKNGPWNLEIYDKFQEPYTKLPETEPDFTFIAVPTEKNDDGSVNLEAVTDAFYTAVKLGSETIILKSTVPMGTCDKLSRSFRNLIFSPEYYGTTIHALPNPNFLVASGPKEVCDNFLQEVYWKIKDNSFKYRWTEDYKTAELAKYMENCFLALKITFCSEFEEIAKENGLSYPELREIFVMDPRMGESHTFINSEQPYYDSHCLNKDIPGLISQAPESSPLMQAIDKINNERKQKYGKNN